METKLEDFVGQSYGFLTVVSPIKVKSLLLKCKCGKEMIMSLGDWSVKKRRSCGCWRKSVGHNLTNSPTYRTWRSLRDRCDKPKDEHYPNYGGRGIIYDPRWADFRTFLADVGLRPEGKTLDRIENNGNYFKDNVKWSTPKEQCNNTRSCIWIEHDGRRQNVRQWSEETGLKHSYILHRHNKGFSLEKIINEANRNYNPINFNNDAPRPNI